MKKRYLFLLLAGVLSLASCQGGKKGNNKVNGSVKSVSLSQESMDVQVGKRSGDVTVTLAGEGEFNKGVKLVSEDEKIAATSFTEISDGETFKVYGKAVGDTKINVISMADETKAASLSVSVKAKEITVISEILSVSLDRETKLFKLSDEPINVAVSISGRGTFDDSATVTLSENPTITVNKETVKDGESLTIAPASLGETTLRVTSVQDSAKYAELIVRVEEDAPVVPPQTEVVQLDCVRHALQEGGASFRVSSFAQGGNIAWSWKENNAEDYVHLEDGADNTGATVSPVIATPEGVKATLVATVGEAKAECEFTVLERPKDIQTYYVSNNSFLAYDDIYFYAWNDFGDQNEAWPGEKLSNPVQNTNGEDCYPFTVDILKYTSFKFNNGKANDELRETEEGLFAQFGMNNNVWFNDEGIHFAVMQKNEPTIRLHDTVVSLYNGETETFGFDCIMGDAEFDVLEGQEFINVLSFSNGSISITGLAVGEARIKIFIPNTEAEAELTVRILDATDVSQFYFSNNKGWENVYLYAWNDNGNKHIWPGEQLTNKLINKEGEDVYTFHLNISQWKNIIINNGDGAQTIDISLSDERFASNNNLYLLDSMDEAGHYEVGFASFEGFSYQISFESSAVDVYNGKQTRVRVNANGSGVSYNVTSGSDKVKIAKFEDSYVNLEYLAAGDAVITATLGDAHATLQVHCIDAVAPVTNETYYFTNNKGWSKVYLYVWNESGHAQDWPGVELTHSELNPYSEPVFDFELDPTVWTSIILNNGTDQQTRDVSLIEEGFATHNNIYPSSDSSPYDIGFADFAPIVLVPTVTFAEDEVNLVNGSDRLVSITAENGSGVVYAITSGADKVQIVAQSDSEIQLHWLAAGDATITATLGESVDTLTVHCLSGVPATVEVTFTVVYETYGNGDLYIAGIPDWDTFTAMTWTDGNVWTITLELLTYEEVTFKFVVRWKDSSPDTWENNPNRTYTPTETTTVACSWQG